VSETPSKPSTADDAAIKPAFDKHELIPAIVQDATSGQVLMLGYMNREAYARTLSDGRVWFWSRSRQAFWMKGESSGNVLAVRSVRLDCDGDTILVQADPAGPTCHTGATSCFFTSVKEAEGAPPSPEQSAELFATISQRLNDRPEGSYIARDGRSLVPLVRRAGGQRPDTRRRLGGAGEAPPLAPDARPERSQ
jgi:phosphoribosyl-AMP cyclohydrolase